MSVIMRALDLGDPSRMPHARAPATPRLRILLLVTELEDYTIAFANGVAAHADVTLAVPARQYAPLARWLDPRIDLRLPFLIGAIATLRSLGRSVPGDVAVAHELAPSFEIVDVGLASKLSSQRREVVVDDRAPLLQ